MANPNVVTPDRIWAGNRFDIEIGNKTIQLHYFGASHGDGEQRLPRFSWRVARHQVPDRGTA